MSSRLDEDAVAVGGPMTVACARPLDRAKAISGLVSDEALASERLGRLTDKVAAALLDANLFSIRLPQADGGLGGTGVELFEATEEIARADGSAGWCMLISNAISTFVHKGATAKALREVFGNGPVACWATLLPKEKSVEVKGRVSRVGQLCLGLKQLAVALGSGRRAARRARWPAMVSRSSAPEGGCRDQGGLV